jgi:hypothetical protein
MHQVATIQSTERALHMKTGFGFGSTPATPRKWKSWLFHVALDQRRK